MILDNLPPHLAELEPLKELAEAEQPEIDGLSNYVSNMLGQFFIDRITDTTIGHWEHFLGLTFTPGASIEQRRAVIASRLSANSPMTPALIKQIAESITNVKMYVSEKPNEYIVVIGVTGVHGEPPNFEELMREIELIRPAHIHIEYAFSYAALQDYSGYTLGELAGYTLEELALGAVL